MRRRDAVRKQQNISQSSGLSRLLGLTAEFNAAVEACAGSAEVRAVHGVRRGSRRIQAMVEMYLREGGAGAKSLRRPARAWLRRLKRLRRAAGSVRDLDVHRKLLKKPLADWEKRAAPDGISGGANSPAIPAADLLQTQAARLAAWLKNERRVQAKALKKKAKKQGQKLKEPEIAFLAAADRMRPPEGRSARTPAEVALDSFAHLAQGMPKLDAGNLHAFRKSVKKARYTAESGADDPRSQSVAGALKQMQDVIGAWHDWLSLTQEAQAALGDDGVDLTAWLAIETERHFTRALATTERVRGELLAKWLADRKRPRERLTGSEPGRKPPSRAAPAAAAANSRAG